MRRTWIFQQQSQIPATPQAVWDRVVTPEGINDEMRPWMTMSVPKGAEGVTIDNLQVGQPVGRAWIRLFGVLPFEYDYLTVALVEPGRRFREESTMLAMREWVHDRTVEASPDGQSQVTDVITFSPRLGFWLSCPIMRRVLSAFFGHRHRRLRAHFTSHP